MADADPRRRFQLAFAVVLLLGLMFRVALVLTWHVPGGDGLQYYALSQELTRAGRFAFGPDKPLSFARMPGYPLFLAYVAVRASPLPLGDHLLRATLWNVVIDVGTALLVYRMLKARLGAWAGLVGLAMVLACPLQFLLSCYGLTETLSTFLATALVALALEVMRAKGRSLFLLAALAGVVAGLAQLVRTDSLTFVPTIGLAFFWAQGPIRRRVAALGLWGLCALVVFAPWPIRNQLRFGEPHPAAYYWRTNQGKTLPMGAVHWARTWSTGEAGQSYIDLVFALEAPLDPNRPGILLPAMYDSPQEKARLAALFERYNREHLSSAVDAEFEALAQERTQRAPLRTFLIRPLLRMFHLFAPVPEWELPMRVSWLRLPAARPAFAIWDIGLYAAALGGLALLLGRGESRRLGLLLAAPLVARALLYSYVVALGATQRYVVEASPILVLLAVEAGCGGWAWASRRRRDPLVRH